LKERTTTEAFGLLFRGYSRVSSLRLMQDRTLDEGSGISSTFSTCPGVRSARQSSGLRLAVRRKPDSRSLHNDTEVLSTSGVFYLAK